MHIVQRNIVIIPPINQFFYSFNYIFVFKGAVRVKETRIVLKKDKLPFRRLTFLRQRHKYCASEQTVY